MSPLISYSNTTVYAKHSLPKGLKSRSSRSCGGTRGSPGVSLTYFRFCCRPPGATGRASSRSQPSCQGAGTAQGRCQGYRDTRGADRWEGTPGALSGIQGQQGLCQGAYIRVHWITVTLSEVYETGSLLLRCFAREKGITIPNKNVSNKM